MLVLVQLVAGSVWPDEVLVTVVALGGQALLVGHYAACQARVQRQNRALWWLLATAMLFWALAYVAIFVLQDIVAADSGHALIDSVLFMARGVPLLLMLTCGIDDEADRRIWRLDIAQAAVYLAAVSLLMLGNPLTDLPSLAVNETHAIRELQALALAVLATLVALLQRDRPGGGLFGPVAAMLLTYVASGLLVNHLFLVTWQVPSGSPWLVFGALPMLAFFLFRGVPPASLPGGLTQLAAPVGIIAPAIIPIATLAAVLTERLRGDPVGPALGMSAVLLYCWRMAMIQMRHRRSIADLVAAHKHAAGLSLTDPLTLLGNRRSFERALAGVTRSGEPLPVTVMMIDADWFKGYNDSLGHGAGDTALRRLAGAIRSAVPPGSAVARIGGEEFAMLTRLGDPAAALELGERIRAAVTALDVAHPRSPLGYLTVSVGIATSITDDSEALMSAADAALYDAKNAGRDCVRLAD
ncbi:GGDEF domain-containing protein [Polymorphobacter fuscus]|uniref:diguanylate cyclase n=1 Tax=Sandarakinorhabdus fusca TaxID=1439888 RepID=A0A7C9GQH4_9SPHN|nr:GGDEF domain-containing protein [Polymorphobacter fuscus]KAB7646433.1 GGDEF domain-containing protein [Polymorphobacter fuscus]MQT17673.1 diguanylate cyclase [Polymorphobacter fuscus]NJC09782.1 diguanylate cyclase (GGDEF)-like protein [Polymorphobacter fuscus]